MAQSSWRSERRSLQKISLFYDSTLTIFEVFPLSLTGGAASLAAAFLLWGPGPAAGKPAHLGEQISGKYQGGAGAGARHRDRLGRDQLGQTEAAPDHRHGYVSF